MPRNDQLTRQWHVLRRLESPRGLTLAELAEGLPDDLPKHPRTLRRDVAALESAGFPLVTERVGGETRWRVIDTFRRVPALPFSATELMALAFSRDLLKPLEGTQIGAALDSALTKATVALPPSGVDFVRRMRDLLSVRVGPYKTYRAHRQTIDSLGRAIAEHRTIQMRYFTATRGTTSRREVDPYHLWYAAGGLYLIAYDHRREAVRTFAVERIRALSVTDHAYQLPLGFSIEDYVRDALVVMRGRQTKVELILDRPTAAWARDRIWHESQELMVLPGGRLRLRLQVADTRELVGWVLSFGSGAQVIRPPLLREKVGAEARRIAQGRGIRSLSSGSDGGSPRRRRGRASRRGAS